MTIWTPVLDEETPRYLAIADAIERDIQRGVLTAGARLPTHRELAQHLGVTVGTVTRGYAEAERRGLTGGEVGRGTFVRSHRAPDDFGWREAAMAEAGSGEIDLSLACPWLPPDGEDGQALARTLGEIARSPGLDDLLRYHSTTALHRHRSVAAEWITGLGLAVTADRIVVTSGSQHGMSVALATLLRPGDTLLAAELTYAGLRSVAQSSGLRMHGIAMDGEGILPEAFADACHETRARVMYCVPTIQNPTSATMSVARRRAIAEVAREHDLIVLEDEIHVARHPDRLPPIASFAPERTLLLTTLSKWASFGLRIGFIAAPESLVERLRAGVRSSLWMPAPLMVEVATRWLADGTAARLGERKLVELEARHAIVTEVLGNRFDVLTAPRSLHLWIRLPEPLRSDVCVAQAAQRGVRIAGAEAFTVGREVPRAVRVSIAMVPEREQLRRGLEAIAEILEGAGQAHANIL